MAFLLALFGTLCWGVAPVFGKLGLARVDPLTGLSLRTLIAASLVFLWVITGGRLGELREVPPAAWVLLGIEAMLATLVGDLAYYAALKRGSASEVTLVMSAAPLVNIWVAYAILGEPLTSYKILGTILIISGVVLIGVQPRP